jgi:hypothetical protein
MMMNGNPRLTTVVLTRMDGYQLGVNCLCLERKERMSQKRKVAKPSLEEQLKNIRKKDGKCFL